MTICGLQRAYHCRGSITVCPPVTQNACEILRSKASYFKIRTITDVCLSLKWFRQTWMQ